jgi:opacity protein-like surface antigen
MRKAAWLFVLALVLAVPAMAQNDHPRAEVFGGYSYVRVSDQGMSTNLNGGSGSIALNVNRWFGIVGDFGGYRFNQSGVSGSVITYMFGPKIAARSNERVTPFVQALFGGAHISALGSSAAENAFAMAVGGGIDAKISQHFAIRLIQAEYLLTKFNDGANNRQNNARISAGIVIRF